MSGGATSAGTAASFLGMWVLMTVGMMLPSIAPALWRYRLAFAAGSGAGASRLALVAAAGYFAFWTMIGVAVYPLGLALAAAVKALSTLASLLPVATGTVVLIAGAVQLTPWKTRQLARCREDADPRCAPSSDLQSAWRHGLRLGRHCSLSCAGPMASLVAIGMMDLRTMGVVTAAITVERLLPVRLRAARVVGIGGMAAGVFLVVRALL